MGICGNKLAGKVFWFYHILGVILSYQKFCPVPRPWGNFFRTKKQNGRRHRLMPRITFKISMLDLINVLPTYRKVGALYPNQSSDFTHDVIRCFHMIFYDFFIIFPEIRYDRYIYCLKSYRPFNNIYIGITRTSYTIQNKRTNFWESGLKLTECINLRFGPLFGVSTGLSVK